MGAGMSEQLVCGLDEAGRGALAGPVVAAAVVLPAGCAHPLIADSKVLHPSLREELAVEIRHLAIAWGIGQAEPEEIVELNVLGATMLAMQRAFAGMGVEPDNIIVDGPYYPPGLPPGRALVRADVRVLAVSAASILAKVHRDALMRDYGRSFPQFGFAQHKGYATPQHLAELARYGPVSIHRSSFRPVAQAARQVAESI